MKSLNVSVKSRGCLLFAFNTDKVDYIRIADCAAQLIHHTLNLPVTLVTDRIVVTEHIDQTITVDNTFSNFRTGYGGGSMWRNGGRYQTYELSPYDETLLLDSDYLMLDQSLLTVLDTTEDYRLIHHNQSPTQYMLNSMGPTGLNYVWATAIAFKRTERTQLMFDLVGRIQRNYEYYRKLYNIQYRNFRNDHAFAIANNILNGYCTKDSQSMPFTMLTIDQPVQAIEIKNNRLVIRQADCAVMLSQQNIHIIDKDYLLSDAHAKFVDQLCQN